MQITGASMVAKFFLTSIWHGGNANMYLTRVILFFSSFVFYGHYIDDLILWWSEVATIPDLMPYFNNNCFGLKFTFAFDAHTISFLDLTM